MRDSAKKFENYARLGINYLIDDHTHLNFSSRKVAIIDKMDRE